MWTALVGGVFAFLQETPTAQPPGFPGQFAIAPFDGVENEIRVARIAGRRPGGGEAASTHHCQMHDGNLSAQWLSARHNGEPWKSVHFIFMAFLAWRRSHRRVLATVHQPLLLHSLAPLTSNTAAKWPERL